MKMGILAGLCAVFFGVAAQAGIYTTFTTGSSGSPVGEIKAGGYFPLGSQLNLSAQGMGSSIYSIELMLTFNDAGALPPGGSGMQGLLTLGTVANSPFVAFNPVVTTSSAGNAIYDVTFSGSPGNPGSGFNGLNPNNTWSLILWDNNSTVGNQLISWSLTVEVPEPVDVALVVFGMLFVAIIVVRRRAKKLAGNRPV